MKKNLWTALAIFEKVDLIGAGYQTSNGNTESDFKQRHFEAVLLAEPGSDVKFQC